MRLKKFKLRNFRRFREKEFSFTDGINIFFGQNEAGKSTLLSAFLQVLFTDVSTKSKSVLSEISSWDSNSLPKLELYFQLDKKEYRLVKNFEDKEQFISFTSNTGQDRITSAVEIKKFIARSIGIPNEDIFTLTALVGQNDVARIGAQKPKEKAAINLREGVQESLTGTGNISVESILEKLRKEIIDLERGWHNPARNNGIIKSLEIEQRDASSRAEEIKAYVNKFGSIIQQSRDAGKESDFLNKEVKNLELLISNNKKRKECEKRLRELQALIVEKERIIQEIGRLENNIKEYRELLRIVEGNNDFNKIVEDLNKINVLKNEKELQIRGIEEEIEGLRKIYSSREKSFRIFILSLLPVLVIMSYQLFKATNSWVIFPAGVGFFISVYLGARGFFLQKNLVQISELKKIIKNIQVSVEKFEKDIKSILHSFDVSSESDLRVKSEKLVRTKSDLEKAKALLKALSGGKTLDETKQEQAALLSEKKNLEAVELNDDIKASYIDPKEEYMRIRELKELIAKRDKAKELQMKSRLETENNKFSYDDLVHAEEKLTRINRDLDYYKEKSEILRLVGRFINEARGDVVSSSSEIVADYMEKYLPILTNNRYHKVRVSPDMEFHIFSDERKDWIVPDDALSRGTIDQIYFLARMAILKIITKGSKTPIILDDPFATFDAERQEGARKVLKELSREHQIILLTCHKDFNSWGNLITI